MPRFAANLTMMFNEHAFLDRFQAAADAGFSSIRRRRPAFRRTARADACRQVPFRL